jgi:hypothetical protein
VGRRCRDRRGRALPRRPGDPRDALEDHEVKASTVAIAVGGVAAAYLAIGSLVVLAARNKKIAACKNAGLSNCAIPIEPLAIVLWPLALSPPTK